MSTIIYHGTDPFRAELCALMNQRLSEGETTVDINGVISILIEHAPS